MCLVICKVAKHTKQREKGHSRTVKRTFGSDHKGKNERRGRTEAELVNKINLECTVSVAQEQILEANLFAERKKYCHVNNVYFFLSKRFRQNQMGKSFNSVMSTSLKKCKVSFRRSCFFWLPSFRKHCSFS